MLSRARESNSKLQHRSSSLPSVRFLPMPSCPLRRGLSAPLSHALVRAIAFKRGITIVNVTSDRMLMAYGFLSRLFEVFDRHQTAVDMVSTSEVSVSVTLDDTQRLAGIIDELKELGEVSVESDQALICLVGEQLKFTPGVAARILSRVEGVDVSEISHGASAIH